MDIINNLLNHVTDTTKKISHRFYSVIFLVVILLILDNTLSFSYYVNNHNKIEQIKGINSILKDTSLTSMEKKNLLILRKNTVFRETWKDRIWNSVSDFNTISFSNFNLKSTPKRDFILHFTTSSWMYIIVTLIFFVLLLIPKYWGKDMIVGSLVLIIACMLLGIFQAKIFSLIPVILNNVTYNYILNIIMSLIIFITIIKLGKTNKNNKKPQ